MRHSLCGTGKGRGALDRILRDLLGEKKVEVTGESHPPGEDLQ